MWGHKPGPAPCPQEIAAASTSASGAWKAEQLAEWGVAWPPKGWRRDLEEKHRLGLRMLPLHYRKSRRGDRRGRNGGADREARRQEVPVRAPQVWVTDIGEVDPADPPPWM